MLRVAVRCAIDRYGKRKGAKAAEFDHIVPVARDGRSTVDNVRLRCRGQSLLHEEEIFGRERIARFRRGATLAGA